jgi:Tol biopolymer transport system component
VAIWVIGNNLFQQAGGEPKIVKVRALTTTTVVSEFNPQISPDGSKVAYKAKKDGKLDLWVRQIASGQTINLTKDEKGIIGDYAWSPDGNWIAFASARDGGGIYVISEYGGAARRVVAHRLEDLGGLNWSPDGKKLVYILKGKLYTVLASGGVPEHIPLPHEARDPAWSPDGERIVLILGSTAFGAASSSADPLIKSGIWTIRPDGSEAIPVFAGPGLLFSPSWANDGKRIFFKYNPAGTRDLWWMPVEKNGKPTGSARPLTAGLNTYDFSLSSDGSKLTYATGG